MYDTQFYEEETKVACTSAALTLPTIFQMIPVSTVIDVGCGTGGWAFVAQDLGRTVIGVDHDVPVDMRLIDTYIDCDLTNGYPCNGFDLAICLEVAEHLPDTSAVPLVNGLARAQAVLFSAATPGQPGVNHIHCQPHDYWHSLFAEHGFGFQHIGPDLPQEVADFYRRNIYLYRRTQ